jgi:hypothetical protein
MCSLPRERVYVDRFLAPKTGTYLTEPLVCNNSRDTHIIDTDGFEEFMKYVVEMG